MSNRPRLLSINSVAFVNNILPLLDVGCLLAHVGASLRLIASPFVSGLNSQPFWLKVYRWRWSHCHLSFEDRLVQEHIVFD